MTFTGALADGIEIAAKEETPRITQQEGPGPTARLFQASETSRALDLLRIEDMARADRDRAVIIRDPRSRRNVRGFFNFTYLHLDGAGSPRGRTMEMLARFIRDHTPVDTRLRPVVHEYFLSPELLKDPIHFLFPVQRLRLSSGDERASTMNTEELQLLGRYLRNGGFVFVDAGGSSSDRRFLREMVEQLRQAIMPDGRLIKLPASHPVYHSFYEYQMGMPGEHESSFGSLPAPSFSDWYYPDRAPGDFRTRGLFGVELDGDVVAVISDFDLHRKWSGPQEDEVASETEESEPDASDEPQAEEERDTDTSTVPYLQAATNIVLFALTRDGGLTRKQPAAVWKRAVPDRELAFSSDGPAAEALKEPDVFALPASLALIMTPLGSTLGAKSMLVTVAGSAPITFRGAGTNAVVVGNLPQGWQQLEASYGGESSTLQVELDGGSVSSVGFHVAGVFFLRRLQLELLEGQRPIEQWMRIFSDLVIEEAFHEGSSYWESLPEPAKKNPPPADADGVRGN